MKTTIAVLLILTSLSASGVGFTVRGGGDEVALEFLAEVNAVLQEIRKEHPDLAPLIADLQPPKEQEILVTDVPLSVVIPGGAQDSIAVNEPGTGRIWVNRARWAAVRSAPLRRAIALHEVASLKLLEGTGEYPVSSAYLAKHGLSSGGEAIRLGRERLPYEPIRERVENTQNVDGVLSSWEVVTVGTRFSWISQTYGYTIVYYHAYHSTEREVLGRPVLTQTWWKVLKRTRNGTAYRQWTRQIRIDPEFGVFERTEPYVSDLYQPHHEEGSVQVYEWKNGRRGSIVEESESRELADGSRQSSVRKRQTRVKTTFDCVEALAGPNEALAVTETEQMERDVAMLTSKARATYDALVATRTWDSTESTAARERFEKMWENVYTSHVKQAYAEARSVYVRNEIRKARETRLRKLQQE